MERAAMLGGRKRLARKRFLVGRAPPALRMAYGMGELTPHMRPASGRRLRASGLLVFRRRGFHPSGADAE